MGKDFVAKTLTETTRAIEGSIFANRYAGQKGLLQRLDPRVKLVTILSLLTMTGLAGSLETLAALYAFTLVLAVLSRISLRFFVIRVWVFIPLFTGIIALPAVLNIVTPGRTLFTVMTFSSPHTFGPFIIPQQITVTEQGVMGAAVLVTRVAASVSMTVLLVVTTEWTRLLKALSVLRIPEIIILILAMTYRYIHLFLRTVEGMLLAKKSRQITDMKIKEEHGWISSRLGVLAGKSYRLSHDVHLAMISRGWTGNPKLLDDFSVGIVDWLWMAFIVTTITLWIVF